MAATERHEPAVGREPSGRFRRRGLAREVFWSEPLTQPGALLAGRSQRYRGQAQPGRLGERHELRRCSGWPSGSVVDTKRAAPESDESGKVCRYSERRAEITREGSHVIPFRNDEHERHRYLGARDELESFHANVARRKAHGLAAARAAMGSFAA